MGSQSAEGGRENSEQIEEIERLQARLHLLAEVTRSFAERTREPQQLLDLVARRLAETVGDHCGITLLSEDGTELVSRAQHDQDPGALRASREVTIERLLVENHPVLKHVLDSGKHLVVAHLDLEAVRTQTTPRYHAYLQATGMHSMLMVPLRGRIASIGMLTLMRHRSDQRPYDASDIDLTLALADHAALAIENCHAYASELVQRRAAVEARDALLDTLRHNRQFFEESRIPMFAISIATERVLAANDAALQLYGYTRAEMLGLSVTDLRLPEDSEQAAARVRAAGMNDLRDVPVRHLRKDGAILQLEGSSYVSTFGQQPARIVTVIDVTARRTAETAIKRLREAFATETQFRAFIENAPDAIVIVDRAGVIRLVNARTELLFGYARSELLGQSIETLVPERLRAGHAARITGYIANPRVRTLAASGLALSGRRKDGSELPIEISLSPLETDQGMLVTSVIRDVTDRKVLEAELQHANRELESFSYSVAHDLRAPLRAIHGFASLLTEDQGDRLDDEGRAWLQNIATSAVRMAALVDALLSLSQLNGSELHPKRVDLSAVAHAVNRELAGREPERAIDVRISPDLHATIDPRLAQVLFENLLANARKFTRNESAPQIEVGATVARGVHAMYVRDNGAGFDMAFASKLFAPFQRLHAESDYPGTGIGLATVQRIVRRHGGEVWAEGVVGAGATFYFTLPGPR